MSVTGRWLAGRAVHAGASRRMVVHARGPPLTRFCDSGSDSHCRNSWSSLSLAHGYIGLLSSALPLQVGAPAGEGRRGKR